MTLRNITKSVSIEAPVGRVFSFLADAANWPRWAVVNVLSVLPAEEGWWHMQTPNGAAKLRIRPDESSGTLDHDFHSAEAQWTVPARVVPNGSGSLFMITFFQPPTFADDFFDQQIALLDRELATLKRLLEA